MRNVVLRMAVVMSAGGSLLLGCATASPSPATSSAPGTQQANGTEVAAATKNPKEGLICETYKATGTMMNRRVCRTPEQLKAEREQAQKMLLDAQHKPDPNL